MYYKIIFVVLSLVFSILLLIMSIVAVMNNKKATILASILTGIFFITFFALRNNTTSRHGYCAVASTTCIIGSLVDEMLIGTDIKNTYIISNGAEPHEYDLTKSDVDKIKNSELLFYNGLGLENSQSMSRAIDDHMHSVSLGDFCAKRRPDKILKYKGACDPHIWLDLEFIVFFVERISNILCEKYPQHAEVIIRNSSNMSARILSVHRRVKEEMKAVPLHKRYLVTTHKGFGYYVQEYININVEKFSDAPEGMSQYNDPSLDDLERVMNFISSNGIRVIFREYGMPDRYIRKIADALISSRGYEVLLSAEMLQSDSVIEKDINDLHYSYPESIALENTYIITKEWAANGKSNNSKRCKRTV
ncbi:MAG: zinc ABC transporter substrate-binding protein [Chlamydiia bacterium]|nr:zinc ABC transporter substrate-binding protein [Chlamydiia bacterium]